MVNASAYIQEGKTLDYTNSTGSTISYKEVVTIAGITDRIYIAAVEIADGDTGALHTEGVWELPAENDTAFNFGDHMYWNSAAGELTKTGVGANLYYAGRCTEAKAQTGTTAKVKLGEMPTVAGPAES